MYNYKIKEVIRVIDGDTLVITIDLGFNLALTQPIRIKGINSPEMRSSNPQEKVLALADKTFVEGWLQGKILFITTTKDDKYGRILGDIICDKTKENLSELMIAAGHAKVYVSK